MTFSHTANDIYATGREVPETIMKGGIADISQICKFAWYDWVMFNYTVNTIASPDKRLTLGRYLGPATDVGLALTAKILKQNSQYVCCSTQRHLTLEETLCTVHIAAQLHFDNMITERFGRKSVPGDFPVEDLTPEYEHYTVAIPWRRTRTTLMRKVSWTTTTLTHSQRRRWKTTISLLRYCSPWVVS